MSLYIYLLASRLDNDTVTRLIFMRYQLAGASKVHFHPQLVTCTDIADRTVNSLINHITVTLTTLSTDWKLINLITVLKVSDYMI